MDGNALLQKIVKELDIIENIYDNIRLVDPVMKKAYSYLKSDVESQNQVCYGFWEKDTACENCISMRAFNLKKTIVKIEFRDAEIYMVTSVPFDYEGSISIIELIKDITNDGIIDIAGMETSEIHKLINQKNISIIKDALTKIYNEQLIYERLPHDILICNEKNVNIALFLIKIINMDVINNAYGYSTGDLILKEVAKVIRNIPRIRNDWVSRYRGPEFILIMHDVNENQVNRICKRINGKISELKLTAKGENINISISIGYHVLKDKIITPVQFIENADKMTYSANKSIQDKSNEKFHDKLFREYLLTLREIEVALLLLKGKSNIEIADTLYVGLSTVKKHVSAIFNKTKVKSRAEFIAKISKK